MRGTQGGRRRGEIGVVWEKERGRVLLRGDATRGEWGFFVFSFSGLEMSLIL